MEFSGFSEEELEEVLNIFREESEEQIQKLNENLLRLESNPADGDVIQEIFREAHSLKGAARMIGYDDIQLIAHKLEDIFGLARKGELKIRPEIIDVLCSSVDAIATIIDETVKNRGKTTVDPNAVVAQLAAIEVSCQLGINLVQQETQESQVTKDSSQEKDELPLPVVQSNVIQPEITDPVDDLNLENENFSDEEIKELKQIFYAESKRNIDQIIDGIKKLRHFPYDKELLTDLYRIAHAIEGSVRIIDFKEIKDPTRSIRDIFEQAVKEEIFINGDILATMDMYLDQVKQIIDSSYQQENGETPLNLEELEKKIEEKFASYKKPEEKPKKPSKQKKSLSSGNIHIDEEEVLKEFGLSTETPKISSENLAEKKKQLEIDPLSLSDEELGDLDLGSLKGVKPQMELIKEIEPDEDISELKAVGSFKHITDDKHFKSMKTPAPTKPDEILTSLSDDFEVFTRNIDNPQVINKVKENISYLKETFTQRNRQELIAIINKLENIFTEAVEQKITVNKEMSDVITQSIESVSDIMKSSGLDPNENVEDPELIYQRLTILHQTAKLSAGIPFERDISPDVFQTPPVIEPVKKELPPEKPIIPKADESLKEETKPEKPLNIPLDTLEKLKPAVKTEPSPKQDVLPEMFKPKKELSPIGDMATIKETANEGADTYTIKTLRVDTRKLDQLVAQVGELIIAKIKAKERLTDIEKLLNLLEEWQREWSKTKYAVKNIDKKPQKSSFMAEGTSIYTPGKDIQAIIRENSDKLANLTNFLNLLYHNIQEDDTRLSLIINELEERIKNVRLLPLTTIFNMYPRMVRDLARDQKKEIDLEIYGSETTVDKKIIEEIKSPLMHIIRNSIDHGIEAPETRSKSGKPKSGKVILAARHLENSVLIEIVDDGRGIDIEAIKEKVLEKELLSSAELAAMNETQIMNIIFWPGFSTGKEVTDISGRGVGMDVVHTKIAQLNGKVKVESKLGHGCRVSIQLPVTMATIQVFLVKILSQTYAIPTSAIKAAVLVSYDEVFSKEGRQAILVDGAPVFLCRLADLLELPVTPEDKSKKDKMTVLVIQTEDSNIGFIVDGLLGDQEILHKNLEPPLIRVRNVAGVTTLGSGEVCLILNVGDLVKTAQMNYGMSLKSTFAQKTLQERKKDILVVDDSVTTRILERNILRAAGYNVTVAVNGLDALTKLATQKFDLIVSDVEMPDITGFELASRLKKDSEFAKIPIVLVTSLASEVDRQKGLSSGASAYITKGGFDQEELLSTIRRLL